MKGNEGQSDICCAQKAHMALTAINGGEQPFVDQFKGNSFVTSRFYIEDVTF
jgi:hypothetical protein